MPKPTPGDMHVNRPLTDMAIAYFQDDASFVTKNGPLIKSTTKSNQYFEFDRADMNRIEVKERAPMTRAPMGGYTLTTTTFTCVRYALAKGVADEDLNNYDTPLDPAADATHYVTTNMNMFLENMWSTTLFTTGVWTTDLTAVTEDPSSTQFVRWDVAGSSPIEDMRTKKATILKPTGKEPNELWLGYEPSLVLVDHPDVIDRYKANGNGDGSKRPVTMQAIAELLGIERVQVSKAIKNTAGENLTAAHSFILGKNALLMYVNRAPNPIVKQPSAFYVFAWTGFYGAEENGFRIKRYREEGLGGDIVEIDSAFVIKPCCPDLGVFFSGVTL